MEFETIRDCERLTVSVKGRLDALSAPALSDGMNGTLDGVTQISFDLAELEYISSAGLRVLLASYKLMMKRGGTMQVQNACSDVMDVLKTSGFAALFGMEILQVVAGRRGDERCSRWDDCKHYCQFYDTVRDAGCTWVMLPRDGGALDCEFYIN